MRRESADAVSGELDQPCRDCLDRDRFGRHDPDDTAPPAEIRADEPRSFSEFLRQHRRALVVLLTLLAAGGFVLVVLPQIAGFGSTLDRLRQGNKLWLVLGVGLEALSIAGYIAVFRAVFSCHGVRIGWRASYEITLAGIVATKLFAAAGAGGVALTAWALRASGLEGRTVARRMASFEILLYAVYMGSLLVVGVGLASGALHGSAPLTMTLLPAAFGAIVIAFVLAFRFASERVESWLRTLSPRSPRTGRLIDRLITVPRTFREGFLTAVEVLSPPRASLLGAVAYWGFDIATLWAAFHAFGAAPAIAVVVMAYFVGQLANAIPLPGGVGGVEGGMIGAFLAFGVNGSVAILAVLAYRAISFWLPTLPGVVAYFQLRRRIARWRGEPQSQLSASGGAA